MKTQSQKISFAITEEERERGEKLPRGLNVSEEMRKAYQNLLKKYGV